MIVKPKLGQDERMYKGLGTMGTYTTALADNMRREPTPYLHRTAVGKGTIQTAAGGRVDFQSRSGGTSIITYDPVTGSVTLNGPLNLSGVFNFQAPAAFSQGGTINQSALIFNANAATSSFISMRDQGGTERIRMEVGTGGFGTIKSSEYDFTSNPGNKFTENFGPNALLADTAGFHAFWVKDSNNTPVWQLASNGQLKQKKAGYIELLGTIPDPGGGPTNTARLYVNVVAGKTRLMVEFPTGTAVLIAAEP